MRDALQFGQRTASDKQSGINVDLSRFLPVMLRQEAVLNHILDELKAARLEKSASRDVDGQPITCPNCGCEIVIPESVVHGQHVRCPRCETKFSFNPA